MKVLVTGGGGFLGTAICRELTTAGHRVISFSRSNHSHLADLGITHVRGSITDAETLIRAAAGCNAIIHTAAKAGVWGSRDEYYGPNVRGTEHVIHACRINHINRLVFTSSPSVIFDGGDQEGIDERVPYPGSYDAPYPETKALAEQAVIAANGPDLATVALRPHLIWGPRDPHLVTRIVERQRRGKLRIIGQGVKRIDSVYVDNAAHAHRLAMEHLQPGAPCAGKAYFITNGEPLPVWELVNGILASAGIGPVEKRISRPAAMAAAATMETVWKRLRISSEPLLTRFVVKELTSSHWFDISAAQKDLGYAPQISIKEGLEALKQWFQAGVFKSR